jgi:hypothetical protein
VEARLLRAQLLISRQEYAEAEGELRECLRRQPDHADAKRFAALCAGAKRDDWPTLLRFAEVFEHSRAWPLADALLAELKTSREGRSQLLAVYRKGIEAAWKGRGERLTLSQEGAFVLGLQGCREVSDLSPLKGMPIASLRLDFCDQVRDLSPLKDMSLLASLRLSNCGQVRDLSPLKDMPLTSLELGGCVQVSDLSPLKGMPLTSLELGGQVRDLSPLKGMPLKSLSLYACVQVRDLSPLKGMPLTGLSLFECRQVQDLSPLKGMPLTWLDLHDCTGLRDLSPLENAPLVDIEALPPQVDRGMNVLRQIKTLKNIQRMAAAEFWKKYDAGEFKQWKP